MAAALHRAGPPRPPARPLPTQSTSRYLVLSKYLFLSLSIPPQPQYPSGPPVIQQTVVVTAPSTICFGEDPVLTACRVCRAQVGRNSL